MLKQYKIITLALTCFGSRRYHHQGAILCLAKTTEYDFSCARRYGCSQCYGGISACCAGVRFTVEAGTASTEPQSTIIHLVSTKFAQCIKQLRPKTSPFIWSWNKNVTDGERKASGGRWVLIGWLAGPKPIRRRIFRFSGKSHNLCVFPSFQAVTDSYRGDRISGLSVIILHFVSHYPRLSVSRE